MIHVAVADEDLTHPQQFTRRQWREIAEIEQHRTPAETEVDVETGVAERIVDQTRLYQHAHDDLSEDSSTEITRSAMHPSSAGRAPCHARTRSRPHSPRR